MWGAEATGSLTGSVVDPAGVAVADLKVLLSRGAWERTVDTDTGGRFTFDKLKPGDYTLRIQAAAFLPVRREKIAIAAGASFTLDTIRLTLSHIEEVLLVTAKGDSLRAHPGSRVDLITADELQEIPIAGRDVMEAVGMTAGVADLSPGRSGNSPDSLTQIYLGGGASASKNFTVDGVPGMDTASMRTMQVTPGMQSIGEVRVISSSYMAEYGRNSAGVISLVTRSGTRQFRASLDWMWRHEGLAANDYFYNRSGIARLLSRAHYATWTLGGPIMVPHRWNTRRTHAFFFFSQDFQSQLISYPARMVRVPTAREIQGDFTQSLDVSGRVYTIYDPLNSQRAFPGQLVPASRFNTTGQNILKLFPAPNFVDPLPSRVNQWNYTATPTTEYPRRTEVARVDWMVRKDMQFYARVSHTADQQNPPFGTWVNGASNFPLSPIHFEQPGRGAAVHLNWAVSPTTINSFVFGVGQSWVRFWPKDDERVSRAASGVNVPQWDAALNAAGVIPNMTFSGVQNYANPSMVNGIPYSSANTFFSFVDNLMRVKGRHTMKAGVYIERSRKDETAQVATRGALSFDRDRNNPLDTNFPYTNALIGVFTSYSEATASPRGQLRFTNHEFYLQDAIRARGNLTLDFGVRFYHNSPMTDRRGQMAAFVPSAYDAARAPMLLRPGYDKAGKKGAIDPLTGTWYPEALIGAFVPNVGDVANGMRRGGVDGFPGGLYTLPPLSMAPRFGFAWDPFHKGRMIVRGGGGVYYDRISAVSALYSLTNPPTVYTPMVYYGTLDSLAETAGRRIYAPPASITSLGGDNHMPVTYSYSFGIQRQFGKYAVADVSYVGSLSRHLLWQRNIDPVAPGANFVDLHPENRDPTAPTRPLPRNFLRPYGGFGDIYMFEFASTSNYNALQATLNRRLYKGLMLVASYTYSKTLGSTSSEYYSVSPFFAPRSRNYGPLAWDMQQSFTARYNYAFPNPGRRLGSRLLKMVADGWQTSGVARFTTGTPFTPSFTTVDGQDITGTPSEAPRVNLIDANAEPARRFGRPARGSFGNTGSGILRVDGINNWDMTLWRQFKVREGKFLQLRCETYNTFNHTQFYAVQPTARFDLQGNQVDPMFLQPTAARAPRRLQFSARLSW